MFADQMDVAEQDSVSNATESRRKRVDYMEIEDTHRYLEDTLQREHEERINSKRRSVDSDVSEEEEDDEEDFELGTEQEEQETAWATNFSAVAIVEEEEDLIPPEANELKYVNMRNYVLAKWRAAVDRYMTEDEACQGLSGVQRGYAQVAWRFLDVNGFINYGVAPAMQREKPEAKHPFTVVVVGAGMAGLAAAKQLQRRGHRVVVVEGHGRPGGRVYTKKMEVDGIEAVADMGGSILTGIDGNPLAVLARQLHIPMHEIEQTEVPLFLEDGSLPARQIDEQVESDYNRLLDDCNDFRDNLGEVSDNISLGVSMQHFWEDRCAQRADAYPDGVGPEEEELRQRFYNWHLANLEFANAASIEELSVRTWDQDDPHELSGPHCFLPGGNLRLIAALTSGLKILYNSKVTRIDYSMEGVAVSTATHTIKGDAVVVTLPLGCLKHGDVAFAPPLPARKVDAIQRLGFGLLNKIILLFPYNFWGAEDMFGRLPEACQDRGEYYLFYSYAQLSGAAVLAGLVSGEAALRFEERTTEEATERAMLMLKDLFEPRGITVPAPLQVLCTQWGKDEMARGSYSSMAVGALGGEDYDLLAESVGERVFFAGEATTRKYPATMHGAFCSGVREAANVVATLKAALKSARKAARKAAEGESSEQAAEPVGVNPLEVKRAALINDYSKVLELVFENRKYPPDKEFGCFSAIRGPRGSPWEGKALLRVHMGASSKGRTTLKANYVALILLLQDLKKLQDVSGGNDARFRLLASLPSVKLVGRAALSGQDLGMMEAILEGRRGLAPRQAPPLPPPPVRQHVSILPAFAEAISSQKRVLSQPQRPDTGSLREY